MAEHHEKLSREVLFLQPHVATDRSNAQNREHGRRSNGAREGGDVVLRSIECGLAFEHPGITREITVLEQGQPALIAAYDSRDLDEPIRLREWQRAQDQRVDNAEDRCRRTEGDGERQYHSGAEAGSKPQQPKSARPEH